MDPDQDVSPLYSSPERNRTQIAVVEEPLDIVALERTGQNRTAAARLLGITFRALRYRLQRLGI